MLPSVAIVIVSYNCREPLRQCLSSLQAGGAIAHVIVIDNASGDGSADMMREEFPSVQLIVNAENRGFAAACNQGIRATTDEFVLLLNPDTVVGPDALARLLTVMHQEPKVGACGPRILGPDGTLQPSCRRFPTLGRVIADEFGLRGAYRMSGWAHDDTREVDQLMGACLMVRRAALNEVGAFDERFFLYFEEVDLCWRLRASGWRVQFVHDATIMHVGGASSRPIRAAALVHRYRSMFAFYRKHYPGWHLLVLKLAVQVSTIARLLIGQTEYATVARCVSRL